MSGIGTGVPGASEKGCLAALASLDRVGPARLRWLTGLGRPSQVWEMLGRGRLCGATGPGGEPDGSSPRLEPGLIARWQALAAASPDLPLEMDRRLASLGVEVLDSDSLPGFLVAEPDPPAALFCSGGIQRELVNTVAIVGTRRASSHGRRVAHQLGHDLSAEGVSVVSGLAIGIDAAAHSGALDGPSPPIAVVGAGHDRPCPQRNRALARRIASNGLVVSEVPPGGGSAPWRFPVRNRLIAAFSQVVVVVESPVTGGSMSTVAEALARDRAVMAVPGPLGRSTSEGCHELLRDGAEICTSADDIIAMLELTQGVGSGDGQPTPNGRARPLLSAPAAAPASSRTGSTRHAPGSRSAEAPAYKGLAAKVLEELAGEPLSLDSVALRCGNSFLEVSDAVAELEGGGAVTVTGGWIERTEQ